MIGIIFAESKRKVSIADAQSISSAIRQSYPLRKDEKMAFLEQSKDFYLLSPCFQ